MHSDTFDTEMISWLKQFKYVAWLKNNRLILSSTMSKSNSTRPSLVTPRLPTANPLLSWAVTTLIILDLHQQLVG